MKQILALLLAMMLVVCLAAVATADGELAEMAGDGTQYRLVEEDAAALDIGMDPVPLTAAPEQMCCALHFVLMLGTLAVTVYYTNDRRQRQRRIHELRRVSVI